MPMSERHDEFVRRAAAAMSFQQLQGRYALYLHLVEIDDGKVDCTEARRRLELTAEELARRSSED